MKIIPAIDMKDGKCVRLIQGEFSRSKVYYDTPLEAAKYFKNLDVTYLHLVDLDGALVGKPINQMWVKKIIEELGMKVEVGGGIRDFNDVKMYLDMGVDRIILSTQAYKDPNFYRMLLKKFPAEKIVISVDAKDGWVAISGWTQITKTSAIEYINKLEKEGIKLVIYTDILKDGMLKGPNFESIREILEKTNINIIVSGGVSSVDDIKKLKELKYSEKIVGVVVGKAIYEGKFDIKKALKEARK